MNASKAESPLPSHGNNIPLLGKQICKMTEIENFFKGFSFAMG
jgi:hypothetical protein